MCDVLAPLHLNEIETLWSVVHRAHQGSPEMMTAARQQLLQAYAGAVQRYLLGACRDVEMAEDLFHEFAVRFLRGDFHRADPVRGRFRDFVRTALSRLVTSRRRQTSRVVLALPADLAAPDDSVESEEDEAFRQSWREHLLSAAWQGLERMEKRTGSPSYTILRFRVQHPDLSSEEMAAQLSQKLGKLWTAAAVRQALHRAREKFSDLLLEAVLQSLDCPDLDHLEDELIELNLLEYCRPALERRRGGC